MNVPTSVRLLRPASSSSGRSVAGGYPRRRCVCLRRCCLTRVLTATTNLASVATASATPVTAVATSRRFQSGPHTFLNNNNNGSTSNSNNSHAGRREGDGRSRPSTASSSANHSTAYAAALDSAGDMDSNNNSSNSGGGGASAALTQEDVLSTQTDTFRSARREASLLSRDSLVQRLYSYSRARFAARRREEVYAVLSELLAARVAAVSLKVLNDAIHLAHVAGLHRTAVALYHTRHAAAQQYPAAQAAAEAEPLAEAEVGEWLGVIPSEHVIDSACAMRDGEELAALAAVCLSRLRHDQRRHAQQQQQQQRHGEEEEQLQRGDRKGAGSSSGPRLPREWLSAFAVLRVLWRLVYLADGHARAARPAEARLELARAEELCAAVVPLLLATMAADPEVGGAGADTPTPSGSGDAGGAAAALTTADGVAAFLRAARRCVAYDGSGDGGEMLFFRLCYRRGLLVPPAVPRGPTPHADALVTDTARFYGNIIATCAAGQHAGDALAYYAAARRLFAGVRRAGEGGADTSPAAAAAAPPPPPPDYLTYRLLSVLLATRRHNARIVAVARELLAEGVPLGVTVWSAVLVAAGEARGTDVALAAHAAALGALRSADSGAAAATTSGGGGGGGGGSASAAGEERHNWEYVLQTALSALSKCGVPDYEGVYLRPPVEEGLVRCSDDFYYGCLLQDAHQSAAPLAAAEAVEARLAEAGVPWTEGLVNRLLKTFLRAEAPRLLEVYRRATQQGLYREVWLQQLLLWADRRRYQLTQDERAYIVAEVHRRHGRGRDRGKHSSTHRANNSGRSAHGGGGGDDAEEAAVLQSLGGVRTHYALLAYDLAHDPCHYFRQHGAPPPSPPSVLDSRMHAFVTRPQHVQRGTAVCPLWTTLPEPFVSLEVEASGDAEWQAAAARRVPLPLSAAPNTEAGGWADSDEVTSSLSATTSSTGSNNNDRSGGGGGNNTSNDSESDDGGDSAEGPRREAFRAYLLEVVKGLQRSNNHVA